METLNIQSTQSPVENCDSRRELNETIPRSQLQRICQSQSLLFQKISEFNHQGIMDIQMEKYQSSLVHFAGAQNILEYAASCGRSIQTALLTATLKNSACAYQKLWQLAIASDYIEGLLININRFFSEKSFQLKNSSQNHEIQSNKSHLKDKFIYCDSIKPNLSNSRCNSLADHKKNLALRKSAGLHSLQYSALLSQTQRHEEAKNAVINSLSHFHTLIDNLLEEEKKSKQKNSQILINLSIYTKTHNDGLKYQVKDTIFRDTTLSLKNLQKHRHFLTFDEDKIRQFSISHIMQISAKELKDEIKESEVSIEQQISQEELVKLAIYVSCCYFALATELRLINNSLTLQQHRKQTQYFKMSRNYHLMAVNIYSTLVLCNSNFLRHIVQSFKINYEIDLYQTALNNSYQLTVENFHREPPKFSDLSSIELDSFKNAKQLQFLIDQNSQQRQLEKTSEAKFTKIAYSSEKSQKNFVTFKKLYKKSLSKQISSRCTKISTIEGYETERNRDKTNCISEFVLLPLNTGKGKSSQKKNKNTKKLKKTSKYKNKSLDRVKSQNNLKIKMHPMNRGTKKQSSNPEKLKTFAPISNTDKKSKRKTLKQNKIQEEYLTRKQPILTNNQKPNKKKLEEHFHKRSANKLKLSNCKSMNQIDLKRKKSQQKIFQRSPLKAKISPKAVIASEYS